jgi:guanylate kinase
MEWEQVRGEYRYGRKKEDLDKIIQSGKTPVMQIEVKGAQKFKKDYDIISFFIVPPSMEEAIARMRKRGTDSEEAIQHRIDRYELELSYKDQYDHLIVNDNLEKAQEEIIEIINREIAPS